MKGKDLWERLLPDDVSRETSSNTETCPSWRAHVVSDRHGQQVVLAVVRVRVFLQTP